jgi:hypothetical protein
VATIEKNSKISKPVPPDLSALFGKKYKIILEEAYYAERPEFRKQEKVWHMLIPCKYGTIGPWGTDTLVASTFRVGNVSAKLRKLPNVKVAQDGSDGINAVFSVSMFDQVAKIMHPKRKMQLSEAERQRRADILRQNRSKKGQS